VREILVAPVGFLVDNLETLYDLDEELSAYVRERKIAFRRSPVPNDHPALLEALAHVVDAAL
jgi:protoheme ferro-lyase